MLKSSFVRLTNGIPTKVLTLGAEVQSRPKKLILIVPGNPGVASYYEEFMETVFRGLGETIPVWAISHAGHAIPEDEDLRKELPEWKGNECLLNLQGQIHHKIQFIDDFVPPDCELTLVGHSIGCKMSLEAMRHFKREGSSRRIRAYMLFPTIERMYETPSGRMAWVQVAYLKRLIVLLVFLISFLPKSILQRFIKGHLSRGPESRSSICCVKATFELLNPIIVMNALSLAHHELQTVRELDVEATNEVAADMRFYFGTVDGWCPLSYYEEMKERMGDQLDAVVCQRKMEHAFVISSSKEMGQIVAEWLLADSKH